MSNLTIAYNGSTIFDGELEGEVTLPTDGMYMEDDVTVVWAGGGTDVSSVLNDNEWSVISEVAQAGEGGSYWSVGDTKSVALSGKVGTLSISTTLNVFIIGINHRNVNRITFQVFKTLQENGVNVALVDNHYGLTSYSGSKYFNLNHWGSGSSPYNTNYGGWKGCDARYDILGSTNVAPSGYGSTLTTYRVGYDAGVTTATSPVENTLMSCLPADLRAVMQPMTVYTDNAAASTHNTASYVTTSVDYLPLLAEYEIFGARTYANKYEKNNQTQYAYYAAGNSAIKYSHSSTGTAVSWWERSPYYNSAVNFCCVGTGENIAYTVASRYSYGLAPAFMV